MELKPPIYWKVKDHEKVKKEIQRVLNTNDAFYFKAESDFKLIPFEDDVPKERASIWTRKELELTLKYQN